MAGDRANHKKKTFFRIYWAHMNMRGLIPKMNEVRLGILLTLISFFLFMANSAVLSLVSHKMFDLNFQARGPVAGKRDVVIVAIDQKSQDVYGRWPWTRTVIAGVIDRIARGGPKAVGLDIVFSYPEERPDFILAGQLLAKAPAAGPLRDALEDALENANADQRLAVSIKKAGNVVPGYFFFTDPAEVKDLKMDVEADYRIIKRSRFGAIKYPESGKKEFTLVSAAGVKPNIKPITDSAAATGYFNMMPDADGTLRKITNVIQFNGKYFPSLSLQLLGLHYGAAPKVIFSDAGVEGFEVGKAFISSDETGGSYVNYYGGDAEFPVVSIADLMGHGYDPPEALEKLFKDKIVLVGATAIGIYDMRVTPFGIQPGLMVHANFIQSILDGRGLNRANWFLIFDALSIAVLGIALTLAMRRLKVFGGLLLASILMAVYVLFQRYMFVEKNTLLDILYPLITIIMVYGGIAFYKYFLEAKEKRYVKEAFGHYLSPAVIGKIMEDPGKLKLGGETRTLTASFSDIKGFSTISEGLTPDALVVLLNEYLTEMTDIVMENQGTLDKYIGDAIVAFYGAPLNYDNHAELACRAALLCQKRLKVLREKWKGEGRPQVEARLGINTGPMLVGNMGSHQRFDYTVIGDEVNLAARLEGINKQYGTYICISENTFNAIGDAFTVRELDLIRVVGRSTPVRIYELVDFSADTADATRQWLRMYGGALALYKARKWEEAIAEFEAVMAMNKEDGASWTYIKRCRIFMATPPDPEWDGVFSHTSK